MSALNRREMLRLGAYGAAGAILSTAASSSVLPSLVVPSTSDPLSPLAPPPQAPAQVLTPAAPGGTVQGNHPADIHVSPSGRHVYISNRGEDNIAVFSIDTATGKVTPVEQVSTGGKSPRNFALDPSGRWLLAANQRSDSIVSFRVDSESGRLTPTGHRVEIPTPVCIKFR